MSLAETNVALCDFTGVVSLNSPVLRYPGNPILTCGLVNKVWAGNPHLQTYTVHNAGIAQIGRGKQAQTIMLFRSHIADGRSVIGKAVSKNGLTNWLVDPKPFLLPAVSNDEFADGVDQDAVIEAEGGGVEDLRANPIGNGQYLLTYSAYHETDKNRVKVMMATTSDFTRIVRHGPISDQDMRNVVVFPEPIAGQASGRQWQALLRPNDKTKEQSGLGHTGGSFEEIRLGYAPTPTGPWSIEETVLRSGFGPNAFDDKIGPGAPPLKTEHGWLNIFHGVRGTMDGNPYSLGVAFHDLADPTQVRMSAKPILMPHKNDCKVGDDQYIHVPNVVFTCGALLMPDGTVAIYYGGNDTVMNVALSHLTVLNELCDTFSQDPLSGKHLYALG